MPDPERNTTKVSQAAINEIQKLGMSKAIKQYHSGNASAEFKTAVERYYSPKRLSDASAAKSASAPPSPESKPEPKPVPMPPSAPAAATRAVAPKGMAEALGAPMKSGPSTPKPNAWKGLVGGGSKSGGGTDLSSLFGKKPSKPSIGQDKAIAQQKAKAEELSNIRVQSRK